MRDRSPGFTFSALQQRCYLIISDRALSKAAAKNLVFDTFSNRQNIQVTTHDPKGLHLLGDHCEGIITSFSFGASLVVQRVKHLPAVGETCIWSLDREGPLEKEMATHIHTLAWKIPWTEKPGRLQSIVSQRVGHYWATSLSFTFHFP